MKAQAKYLASPKGKAAQRRYNISLKGRAKQRRYNFSLKGRARDKAFYISPKGHALRARKGYGPLLPRGKEVSYDDSHIIAKLCKTLGVELDSLTLEDR